ncbi:very short patch repair endonuclease [Cryobacterium psychrotolerans]|uniref:very short patch repair endonuclease n=1 Tax=Cryobacterium psychrotolerans TaxID=386301 RepID=UPI000B808482|nr:very short patch repair endonuclease [Cryobacterium psychrotolerans]TFD83104.1 DNA mismatch endonuclease Vsr [Cryobacterium psychrotolerans]
MEIDSLRRRGYFGATVPNGSWASSPAVRRSMQGNTYRDTKPELVVRRLVHARGLRYRVCARPLPNLKRTADLVFSRARVAVFLDGCFWHGCSLHHTSPTTNSGYWAVKILKNMIRDQETNCILQNADWTVLRFWEHQNAQEVAEAIEWVVLDQA